MEGKPIRQLDSAVSLSNGDFFVLGQTDGRTRKSNLDQLRAFIATLIGDNTGQTTAELVAAFDTFFEGTGWRDGTGIPAPKLTKFQLTPISGQRSVTIDFTPDDTELILAFRNGNLVEPESRTGRTFIYPGPDFQTDEVATILAYPV